MVRIFLFIYLLLIPAYLWSQSTDYLTLVKAESELSQLFDRLYEEGKHGQEGLLDTIQSLMHSVLSQKGSMDFPWTRLNRIGVIDSEDKQVRIFTWHVMVNPDSYKYYGYIQVAQKRGKVRLTTLEDNGLPQRGSFMVDQSSSNWYGKLYYQVLTHRIRRKVTYTLLGMDFNTSRSNIKTVEMIDIQRHQPRFLKGRFIKANDVADRMVLEYGDQVAVSVRYDLELKLITFDHLVPFHPIYEGNFEFYGPDGSYDGLELEQGNWIYRADIDARNPN